MPSSVIKPKCSCQRCSRGKAALRLCSSGYCAMAAFTCRFNSAGSFAAVIFARLFERQGARFCRHLVVLKQHRHRAVGLPIDIGGTLEQHKILCFDCRRRSKDRFHLFLAHSFGDLVDIGRGKTLAGAREKQCAKSKPDALETTSLHHLPRLVSLLSTSSFLNVTTANLFPSS